MSHRRIHADNFDAHFVTFSCYHRRNHLDHTIPRRIVIDALAEQLARIDGSCLGFVVMPNHVHAILWFQAVGKISELMKQWKRTSSHRIKQQLRTMPIYESQLGAGGPIWQPGYYDFNIYSDSKLQEKLDYIHSNPVRAGLV
jgi:putative transposase